MTSVVDSHKVVDRNIAQGRVVYLLALVVLVQTIYPITAENTALSLLIYNGFTVLLIFSGLLVARETPYSFGILVGLGLTYAVTIVFYTLNTDRVLTLLIAYLAYALFQIMVIRTLLQYMFAMRSVSRDVIYAAVAVYFLLGAVFVPLYGSLEVITFAQTGGHAFVDGTVPEVEPVPWQNLIYYSYATLTTLGYGDILPVTMWARSAASLQAVIGVLYITIIMARLVSLYVSQEQEQADER